MRFSFFLACTMALGTWAAPVAYLQVRRDPSGKLAVKTVVRPDDILERDPLSQSRRGLVEHIPLHTF
ncbi:hypothetical protein VM1G_11580 [Cytospora mali]|uniref:Uncharacterized protein n=1 Tax=Cytospora mali TaxID=578113 RepID=A0A194VVY8_CYTMA|nr:hypothetical protein VM1G_11580 [Valsa mali]